MNRTLDKMAARAHAAGQHRWAAGPRNGEAMMMRMAGKAGEAERAVRKDLRDENLPDHPAAAVALADLAITALDFAAGFGHQVPDLFAEPVIVVDKVTGEERNSTRAEFLPDDSLAALLVINRCVQMLASAEEAGAFNSGVLIGTIIAYAAAWAEKFGYDFWGALEAKLAFNEAAASAT